LQSSPVAEFVIGKYAKNPSKFVSLRDGRLEFMTTEGVFKFPLDKNLGDGRIDLLVFDKLSYQQHFLTVLKLKFTNWNITITATDV
jgi:hypothetical protein